MNRKKQKKGEYEKEIDVLSPKKRAILFNYREVQGTD